MREKQKTFEETYAEAQVNVVKTLADTELAKIEEPSKLEKAKTQKEREEIIAAAYKLMGRVEGVNFMQKVAQCATLVLLKEVKEHKVYKEMGFSRWEDYCESTGFSRRHIDEQLQNLEEFGEEFLAQCADFGVGTKDLRKLRSASSDGSLSINKDDNTITIELTNGDKTTTEVIPLSNTEELKEALEHIIETKDIQIKSMRQTNEFNEKRYADTEKALRKTQKELSSITKTGEIEGIPADDYPVYKELAGITENITTIYAALQRIAQGKEELSDANIQYLQGTIMYFCHMGGELSFNVPSYGGFYGDLNVTQEDLDAAASLPLPGVRNLPGHRPKSE